MKKTLLSIFALAALFSQHTFSVFFHENETADTQKKFLISMSIAATREYNCDISEYTLQELITYRNHISHRYTFVNNVLNECLEFNKQNKDNDINKHIKKLRSIRHDFYISQNALNKRCKQKITNSLQKSKIHIAQFNIIEQYSLPAISFLKSNVEDTMQFAKKILAEYTDIEHEDRLIESAILKLTKRIVYYKTKALPFLQKTINRKQNVEQSQNSQQKKMLLIKSVQETDAIMDSTVTKNTSLHN